MVWEEFEIHRSQEVKVNVLLPELQRSWMGWKYRLGCCLNRNCSICHTFDMFFPPNLNLHSITIARLKGSARPGRPVTCQWRNIMELPRKNVTSRLIESMGLSVTLRLRRQWRQSACMWHIQAKQGRCGKNTQHATGPLHPVAHSKAQPNHECEINWLGEKTTTTLHSVVVRISVEEFCIYFPALSVATWFGPWEAAGHALFWRNWALRPD